MRAGGFRDRQPFFFSALFGKAFELPLNISL
jgi:hypothetical protein